MPALGRLRYWRVRAGLTQDELAEKAHLTRTTIIRLEAGDPNPRVTTLRRLARALSTPQHRLTIEDLFGE